MPLPRVVPAERPHELATKLIGIFDSYREMFANPVIQDRDNGMLPEVMYTELLERWPRELGEAAVARAGALA